MKRKLVETNLKLFGTLLTHKTEFILVKVSIFNFY